MRCLPQRSDGLVVKACAVSTKKQLHRFGIVRLQRLCSTCAESRLQQTRWGEARTLCSCNSMMRNQQWNPRRVRASSSTTARSNADSKRGTACLQGLAKVWIPPNKYAAMRLGDVWRRGSWPPVVLGSCAGIFIFGPAQKKAKVPQYRLRRPQASSVTPLNTTQYFPAISRAHLPHKLQAVQETSQP